MKPIHKSNVKIIISLLIIIGIVVLTIIPLKTNALPIPIDEKDKDNGNGEPIFCQTKFHKETVLGYWKLNENSGFNATDSSYNERHGIVQNDSWSNGKLNNALNFSVDSAQNVNCGSINWSGAFSLEFWLYLYENFSRICLFNSYDFAGGKGIFIARLFQVLGVYLFEPPYVAFFTYTQVPINKWLHIVFTFDGIEANNSKMYKNGKEWNRLGTQLTGNPLNFNTSWNFTIGQSPFVFYLAPNGLMDNVILYNLELSEAEVIFQWNNSYGREGYPDVDAPIIYDIQERNPLQLGLRKSICFKVCDNNDTDTVLIEIKGVNYTMEQISDFYYCFTDYKPNYTGVCHYTIYINDTFGNMNVYYRKIIVLDGFLISGGLGIMILLIGLMFFFYRKSDKFVILLSIFLFSLLIGMMSISIIGFPFTPYLSLFFILFQSILFTKKSLTLYQNKGVII